MAMQSVFGPDWIVSRVSACCRNGGFTVEGRNLNYTPDEPNHKFSWDVQAKNLLWDRYDLTNAEWMPGCLERFEHAKRTQSIND